MRACLALSAGLLQITAVVAVVVPIILPTASRLVLEVLEAVEQVDITERQMAHMAQQILAAAVVAVATRQQSAEAEMAGQE